MGGLNMDPRVTELHGIMPMANIGLVMAHHSHRQHLTSAKLAVPTTAWVRAVDVVIAPIIDSVGRLSVQPRTRTVFRDVLSPKLSYGELRMQNAGWLTGRDV